MTAIIGYINKVENKSVGVLSADNLEGDSQCKVDKLTKYCDRFVIGITGLEVVDWVIASTVGHLDNFISSKIIINSIDELGQNLTEIFKDVFQRLKKESVWYESQQLDSHSMLIVLDVLENKLYYSDIGCVWKIDTNPDYEIKFLELKSGLYSFGAVVQSQSNLYDLESYSEFDKKTILDKLNEKFKQYKQSEPMTVGNQGATYTNFLGEETSYSYCSCYDSYLDIIDNIIKRHKYHKSLNS